MVGGFFFFWVFVLGGGGWGGGGGVGRVCVCVLCADWGGEVCRHTCGQAAMRAFELLSPACCGGRAGGGPSPRPHASRENIQIISQRWTSSRDACGRGHPGPPAAPSPPPPRKQTRRPSGARRRPHASREHVQTTRSRLRCSRHACGRGHEEPPPAVAVAALSPPPPPRTRAVVARTHLCLLVRERRASDASADDDQVPDLNCDVRMERERGRACRCERPHTHPASIEHRESPPHSHLGVGGIIVA